MAASVAHIAPRSGVGGDTPGEPDWRGRPDRGAAAASPGLAALAIQERHHTARLMVCALTAILALCCLIPIANARPRYRPDR